MKKKESRLNDYAACIENLKWLGKDLLESTNLPSKASKELTRKLENFSYNLRISDHWKVYKKDYTVDLFKNIINSLHRLLKEFSDFVFPENAKDKKDYFMKQLEDAFYFTAKSIDK